jgi:hypothetical protein
MIELRCKCDVTAFMARQCVVGQPRQAARNPPLVQDAPMLGLYGSRYTLPGTDDEVIGRSGNHAVTSVRI